MNDISTELAVEVQASELSPGKESPDEHWLVRLRKLDKPWIILLLLFCVTGALGLPMLWFSKSISKPAKFVLTAVVLLYTIFLLTSFAALMAWCYHRIASTF